MSTAYKLDFTSYPVSRTETLGAIFKRDTEGIKTRALR